VVGGKYTTYRSMAERVVDAIGRRLGRGTKGRTRDFALPGARGAARVTGLDAEDTRHLISRYGRRAEEVAEFVRREPGRVVDGEPDLRGELAFARECEMAVTDADALLRRTRLGLFRPELLSASRDGFKSRDR
jgi:glycerol-3-phosphate dehydrogenase